MNYSIIKLHIFVLAFIGITIVSPIVHGQTDSMEQRMSRKISIDARSMNIIDVISFIAKQGDFNTVISPQVAGSASLTLQNVDITTALKMIATTNHLAYAIDNDIVHIMTNTEYMAAYGKKFNDSLVVSVAHLQYSKPAYVLAVLDNIKSNAGKITIDEDTGSIMMEDTPSSIELMKKTIARIEQPLETVVYALKYAKAIEVLPALQSRIDSKGVGTTSIDDRSNQIFVHVFPGRQAEIGKIIRSLDIPNKQVLIETRILQVTLKPTFDSGVNWSALIKNNGKNKFNVKTVLNNDNTSDFFGQIGVGTIDVDEFGAQIQLLEGVSESKIISSPKILAANNEEAKIHVGDSVPYISTTATGGGDNAFRIENPRFIDEGVIISVTPTINSDGMVTMHIRPKISTIVGRIESIQGGIPQVNTTEIDTTLMVQDGMTIVMAGLRQDQKRHTKAGVPGFKDIPYVSNLFSKNADDFSSTELVILITPRIVKGIASDDNVSGTIKSSKKY